MDQDSRGERGVQVFRLGVRVKSEKSKHVQFRELYVYRTLDMKKNRSFLVASLTITVLVTICCSFNYTVSTRFPCTWIFPCGSLPRPRGAPVVT